MTERSLASPPRMPRARSFAPTATRAAVVLAVAGLAVLWMARWLWRAHYLYEWDSAQYALGILRFDVREHRPHPPGYPLWVLLLKGMHVFVEDLNAAQITLDFVVTGVATVVFYRLVRALYGAAPALLASALLLFSPPVIFYNAVASTYPADLLISTVLGALSARLWCGKKSAGMEAVFAIALLAGIRQSGAVMMVPLVFASLVRAYRFEVRCWTSSALLAVATLAAWYVPTAQMNGGIAAYQAYTTATIRGYFHMTSALFGAPVAVHLAMLRDNAVWATAAIVVPALVTMALWSVGKVVTPAALRPAAAAKLGAGFYFLWIVPNVLYVTLLHSVKPGYLVLDLPPVIVVFAGVAAASLERIDIRWRGSAIVVAASLAFVSGLATTALAQGRYQGTLDRTTLASVRDSDDDTRAIEALVRSAPGPAATLVVVLSSGPFGPSYRSLSVHLPDTTVGGLSPDGPDGLLRQFSNYEFRDDYRESKVLAPEVRRILWVQVPATALVQSIRAHIPSTHVVFYGKTVKVLESDLGDEDFDAHLDLARAYHFVRAGTSPDSTCRLGGGFIDPAHRGDLLWGAGPRSEVLVYERGASPIRLTFRVAVAPSPEQEVWVTANGARLAVIRPRSDAPMVVEFQGVAGENRVLLDYSRYNHHPDDFAPLDPRPFGVAFREIRCEWGAETRTLFAL